MPVDFVSTSGAPKAIGPYSQAVSAHGFLFTAGQVALDPATGERLSTLVEGRPVAVLSGPNIADEIARDLPAAAVIASDDERLVQRQALGESRRPRCLRQP